MRRAGPLKLNVKRHQLPESCKRSERSACVAGWRKENFQHDDTNFFPSDEFEPDTVTQPSYCRVSAILILFCSNNRLNPSLGREVETEKLNRF